MNCPSESADGEANLMEFVAGRVRGPAGALLREHLEDCPRCSDYVVSQRTLWLVLDEWEPLVESPAFSAGFAARMASLPPDPLHIRLARFASACMMKPAFKLTAVTALLAISIYLRNPFATPSVPESLPVPSHPAQVVSPIEAEQIDRAFDDLQLLHQLDLSDGAKDPARSM